MEESEINEHVRKLRGEVHSTKVCFDEKAVSEGRPIIVTDLNGNKYQLEQCLGQGFEGEVWKVSTTGSKMNSNYALKFEIGDIDIGVQLEREYKTLKKLDHPFIVKPIKYWCGTLMGNSEDKGIFKSHHRGHMVTQLVHGQPLSKCQFAQTRSKLNLMLDLVDVVKYLNITKKIFHCDLTVANIIITQINGHNRPVLVDFGFPQSVTDFHHLDLKDLGLIYLHLLGFNESQIDQFKKNLNWSLNPDGTFDLRQVQNALNVPLDTDQLNVLLAFLDGRSHDDVIKCLGEHTPGDTPGDTP
jgi:serine/threonine protein kinase